MRNYRIISSFLLFLIMLSLLTHTATASIDLVSTPEVNVKLDATAGDAKQTSQNVNLVFKNSGETTITVNANITSDQPPGITITCLDPTKTAHAESTFTIRINVKVDGDVSEGTYPATIRLNDGINDVNYPFNIIVDKLLPAKLASMQNIDMGTIVFDKPKSTMEKTGYVVEKTLVVRNEGDATMKVQSIGQYGTPEAGITFSASPASPNVPAKDSVKVTIKATIPVDAPEGKLSAGIIQVNAGAAGNRNVPVTLEIKHKVIFEITPYSSDLGSVDLLKSIQNHVYLKETLGYKDIHNVSVTRHPNTNITGNGKDDWMKVDLTSTTIPAGGSLDVTFKMQFRGEAEIGQTYDWGYLISSSEGDKDVYFKAVSRPVDTSITRSTLSTMSTSLDPDISSIASRTLTMLKDAENSNMTSNEWANVATVSITTASFLKSMEASQHDIEAIDHFSALDHLLIAKMSADTIKKSATAPDQKNIYSKCNAYLTKTLNSEAEYFMDNAVSTKDTNLKDSLFAYDAASRVYGLLENREKENELDSISDDLLTLHDEYVRSANNKRIDTDKAMRLVSSENLYKLGENEYLVNPFEFDSAKKRFDISIEQMTNASEEYQLAGEIELYNETLSKKNKISQQWDFLKIRFIALMVVYILIFTVLVIWSIFAMLTYTKDCDEEDLGNILIFG